LSDELAVLVNHTIWNVCILIFDTHTKKKKHKIEKKNYSKKPKMPKELRKKVHVRKKKKKKEIKKDKPYFQSVLCPLLWVFRSHT